MTFLRIILWFSVYFLSLPGIPYHRCAAEYRCPFPDSRLDDPAGVPLLFRLFPAAHRTVPYHCISDDGSKAALADTDIFFREFLPSLLCCGLIPSGIPSAVSEQSDSFHFPPGWICAPESDPRFPRHNMALHGSVWPETSAAAHRTPATSFLSGPVCDRQNIPDGRSGRWSLRSGSFLDSCDKSPSRKDRVCSESH